MMMVKPEYTLEDATKLVMSNDYKERFLAEFMELNIRSKKLEATLKKYKEGTLEFTPSCSYELLSNQLKAMNDYREILIERAHIEDVEIKDLDGSVL